MERQLRFRSYIKGVRRIRHGCFLLVVIFLQLRKRLCTKSMIQVVPVYNCLRTTLVHVPGTCT
jgi:hypothetical protein